MVSIPFIVREASQYAKLHIKVTPSWCMIKQINNENKIQIGSTHGMEIAIAVLKFIGGVIPLVTDLLKALM
ncbi:hypothetical protein COF61_27765 [Bacillus toyonensis]|uniref:hypothetical protein n=1 Tax=Bacillus toyonensis TaxID=155322 RepID=UPI000BFE61CE|nr:hypothetical protein [Bacillus toyonensis]PHD55745.1 hypothetical protein COF61_27765 [Bacillus toyonensis]